MSEHDIFTAEILEDQLFLMNLLRLRIAKNGGSNKDISSLFVEGTDVSKLFLSPCELERIKTKNVDMLFSMDTMDSLNIVMIMRTICNCCSLLYQLYFPEKWSRSLDNSCKTSLEVDKEIGHQLTYRWTTTNINLISQAIGKVLDFLIIFGSLHVLPDGVLSPNYLCHKCRSKNVLSQLSEMTHTCSVSVDTCNHILSKRPCNILDKTCLNQEKKGDAEIGIFPFGKKKVSKIDLEELSLGKRIAKNRKIQEMKAMKNVLKRVEETYKKSRETLDSLEEDKFISTSVYETIGQIIKFAKKREMCLERFNCHLSETVDEALLQTCEIRSNLDEEKRERFLQNLSSVALEKVSSKMAQEIFYGLLLDPITLTDKTNAMIRTSILAKRFLLTFGIQADEIAVTSNKLNSISICEILESNYKSVEERFLKAVVVLYVYNKWLNVLDIPPEFHLKFHRGDINVEESGVYFLYEDEMIGLYLSNQNTFKFVYETVTELCLLHVIYLSEILPPKFQLELQMVT